MKVKRNLNQTGPKKQANGQLKAIVKGSGFTQRYLCQVWEVSESFFSRVLAGTKTSRPLEQKIYSLSVLSKDYIKDLNDIIRS